VWRRSVWAADSRCPIATSCDTPDPDATIRSALSRWRHGFEPRWDDQQKTRLEALIATVARGERISRLDLLLGSVLAVRTLGLEAVPRPRRRPSARGHIRERGRETWELRVSLGRDPIIRRDRYKTRTFKGGKKDAEKELRSLLSTVKAGVVSEGTFGDLLERWYLVASTSTARRHRDQRFAGPVAERKGRRPNTAIGIRPSKAPVCLGQ
jgi:hypothetical protein